MKYKFREYNDILKKMLNEEDTIDNILVRYFQSKPSKEERLMLKKPQEWSEYAFEKELQYYVSFYNQENKPFVCVCFSTLSITVNFLDYNYKNELENYLKMIYWRFNRQHYFKKDELIPNPDNKLFLSQIEIYQEDYKEKLTYKALFKNDSNLMKISTTNLKKNPKSYSNEKKETKVNLAHNFIKAPEHYLDFKHLFNYKEILKPEYLDIPVKKYIYQGGSRFYKDENGNLIEDN